MTDIQNMTADELRALVQRMRLNNQRKLTLKVSAKGAVSVYGMGRFPVTLYKSQWERLFGEVDTIKAFITDNAPLLADDKAAA